MVHPWFSILIQPQNILGTAPLSVQTFIAISLPWDISALAGMLSLDIKKSHMSDRFHRWLDAVPGSNHSHCTPRSSEFDWYEYTTAFNCSQSGCRTHAINFLASNPEHPDFEEDYVLAALDLGNGKMGELGLSYFDKPGGGYAVGTRRSLVERGGNSQLTSDCHDAFQTFKDVKEKFNLDLEFDLINVCPSSGKEAFQNELKI
jgi:hypothetical protein